MGAAVCRGAPNWINRWSAASNLVPPLASAREKLAQFLVPVLNNMPRAPMCFQGPVGFLQQDTRTFVPTKNVETCLQPWKVLIRWPLPGANVYHVRPPSTSTGKRGSYVQCMHCAM